MCGGGGLRVERSETEVESIRVRQAEEAEAEAAAARAEAFTEQRLKDATIRCSLENLRKQVEDEMEDMLRSKTQGRMAEIQVRPVIHNLCPSTCRSPLA
jgi:hypothetical protein